MQGGKVAVASVGYKDRERGRITSKEFVRSLGLTLILHSRICRDKRRALGVMFLAGNPRRGDEVPG